VFKDPRLPILLPFWRTVTKIGPVALVVRHPVQVAASLGRRDDILPEEAAALWTRHNVDAWLNGRHPQIVWFEDLYSEPDVVVARFASRFGMPTPRRSAGLIRAAVNPTLRHHRESADPVDPTMTIAVGLYDTLRHEKPDAIDDLCRDLRTS